VTAVPQTSASPAVLLVEDEPLIRSVYAWGLRSAGFHVFEAENGQEAAAVFEREADAIDVVVTDVVMPVMGGVDLAALARARKPAVKILFISGFVAFLPVGGADAVLQKPCTRADLVSAVQELLFPEPRV
jgi:CheY-like chemotaxis protein